MKATKRADGRYQMTVYLGKDASGKRIKKTVYGKTRKEVEAKADLLKAQLGKGLDMTTSVTVEQWAGIWLANKKLSVGESSRAIYKAVVDRTVSYLGGMDIRDVRPLHLQRIIDDLAVENPVTGKPASARLLSYHVNTWSQMYDYARRNSITDRDPAADVILPRGMEKHRREPVSPAERALILNTPHRMQTAALIMLLAGLRRGEVIPLTWHDIDLTARTISVNKAVEYIDRKPHVKPPKTKAGYRTVYLQKTLLDHLTAVRPSDPEEGALVFPDLSGRMYTADEFKRGWESYMADLSAKESGQNKNSPKFKRTVSFTPHQLRHTFCSDMYIAGVDVLTAQQQMGHSSLSITLEVYTHLSTERNKAEMAKLDG